MGTHKLVPQIRRSGNPRRSEMTCSGRSLCYTFFNWLPDWVLIVSLSEFHKGQLQYHSPKKKVIFSCTILTSVHKRFTLQKNRYCYLLYQNCSRLIVIFLTFLMIHRFVCFDITPLTVRGIQALNFKIEVVLYKSISVSSILYSKDVLLEHDSTYCDTNLAINGYF